jgi:hypothetical protein
MLANVGPTAFQKFAKTWPNLYFVSLYKITHVLSDVLKSKYSVMKVKLTYDN